MRAWPFIFGFVVLVLGAAWWFTSAPRPAETAERIALGPEPSEFTAPEPPATELDDPDAPIAAAGDASGTEESDRRASAAEVKPEAPDPVDHTKPTAPLEFVVVDERSQAPLPRFLVRLGDSAGRKIEVVTNERGEATTTPLALGAVDAVMLDHAGRGGKPETLAVDHIEKVSRPHVLSLASGPTYRVSFTPTTGPDVNGIRLRLFLENEEGEGGSTLLEPLRAQEPYWHEGEEYWVRFRAIDEAFTRGRRIEARSRDGLWSGRAGATVAVGQSAQPVVIQLEACGVVRGHVTAAGAPIAGVVVTFQVQADPGQKRPYTATERTDGNGDYRIEFVRPGDARMNLTSLTCEASSRNVALHSGETLVQDFDLKPLPTVGRVAGTVVSETGTYEPKVGVNLVRAGNERGDPPRLRTNVRWKTSEGRRVGEFDFGLLPKGKYRLDFDRVDWFEWTQRRLEVEAPKEDIVVRIADRALTADFAIDVHDSDNGFALKHAHLLLETIDGERSSWIDSGDVVIKGYPEDKRLRWRLDKAGYPSQIGDMKSFTVTTQEDGRRKRTAEINLQPGWSEVVRVTYGRDEKPIANAAVTVDGREAGKTDKSGLLRVSSREKPEALTVALDGWRMDGGVDLRPPAQRNYRRFLDVHMRQTKKK
jgi:hypothetical protein